MAAMRDERHRIPVSPLNVLIALLPVAFGVYMGVGLYRDFSRIDELAGAPRVRPAPRAAPLPGRPPRGHGAPPGRTAVLGGGYAAVAQWLRPLHRLPAAGAGEPLDGSHRHHPGLGARRAVDVLPIGDFTPAQRRIVELAAELLAIDLGLEIRLLAGIPVDAAWPETALRPDDRWGEDQLLVPYILDGLLAPRLRDDAAALLAITARDLWSGDEWTYALGETDPARRIGVWSLFRLGDPGGDEDERREVLRAALATARREVARMLPLSHGSPFACGLGGPEPGGGVGDRGPSWLCPECEARLLEATGVDPVWRYERLVEFYGENDLGEEEWFYERSLYAVRHLDGLAPVWGAPGGAAGGRL